MNTSTFTRRIAVLIAAAMAFSAFVGGAGAHTSDEHGEITVHDEPDGPPANDIECEFWVKGHNMTAEEGEIRLFHHQADFSNTETLGNYTGVPDANGTFDFMEGPFNYSEGWGDHFVYATLNESHRTNMTEMNYEPCPEEEPEPPEEEPEVPMCPANVETTAHDDETVSLSWGASAGADSYNVYRATAGESFEHVAEVESTSFTDTETEADVTYEYRVTAANEAGESEACPVVEVTAIPVFGTPAIAALAAVGGIGAMMALRRRG